MTLPGWLERVRAALCCPTPAETLMYGAPLTAGRSPRWPAARAAWLKAHPACAATGSTADIEVHHVVPFHLAPGRELDPTNFITLCRPMHFWLGHGGDWSAYNPFVVHDAAAVSRRVRSRVYDLV